MTPNIRRYAVTVEVTVVNAKLAIKAARHKAAVLGNRRGVVQDTGDAVNWLVDPGSLLNEGVEIDGLTVAKEIL